jgi:hypothetical protein
MISPAFRSRPLGFALVTLGFVACTTLTKVDWSLIPAEQTAAGSSGSGGRAGSSQGGQSDGPGGVAGESSGGAGQGGQDEGGAAGDTGLAGAPGGGTDTAGTGGGGSGGTAGGGSGGTAGGGGMGGSGGSAGSSTGAPKCTTAPAVPAVINLTGKIVMFDGGAQAAGVAWGGRAGLDAKCVAAAGVIGLTKTNVHAFISADADEPLSPGADGNYVFKYGMPTVPAVVSKLGLKIADSAGQITNFNLSLICAGVVSPDVTAWFSGVTDGGGFDNTLNCASWSLRDESLIVHGNVGLTDTTNTLFHDSLLADHWVSCTNSDAHVLCVAWGD